jgi:hypothetical protein
LCVAGEYIVDIIDHFNATYCLLVTGLLECILVGWCYDIPEYLKDGDLRKLLTSSRLAREIQAHTGEDPSWLPFCWSYLVKFITPAIVLGLFLFNVSKDLTSNYGGYPAWASGLFGWFFCVVLPMSSVVLGFFLPMDEMPQPPAKGSSAAADPLLGNADLM